MAILNIQPSVGELVRKRNLGLDIEQYNTGSNKINSNTMLMTKESEYKDAQKKRESIIARLDLDTGVNKTETGYNTDLGIDQINKLTGTGKQKDLLRNKWIERGCPKSSTKSKMLIETNPRSMSVKSYKVDKAIKNCKNYKYNKIINSNPVKER